MASGAFISKIWRTMTMYRYSYVVYGLPNYCSESIINLTSTSCLMTSASGLTQSYRLMILSQALLKIHPIQYYKSVFIINSFIHKFWRCWKRWRIFSISNVRAQRIASETMLFLDFTANLGWHFYWLAREDIPISETKETSRNGKGRVKLRVWKYRLLKHGQ